MIGNWLKKSRSIHELYRIMNAILTLWSNAVSTHTFAYAAGAHPCRARRRTGRKENSDARESANTARLGVDRKGNSCRNHRRGRQGKLGECVARSGGQRSSRP